MNIEKTFGDITVGDNLYYAGIDGFGIWKTPILSMELDKDALKDIDHRVPDVIITTTEFQITLNRLHITHFKNKVFVNEAGTYISPSKKYLVEAIIKEQDSKIKFWEDRKSRLLEIYNASND